MEVITGQFAVQDFDATDFDDAVAGARIQAGGFGVEDDLTHAREDSKGVGKTGKYNKISAISTL
jgi:hypothetical protein